MAPSGAIFILTKVLYFVAEVDILIPIDIFINKERRKK
tara:strand:+ start:585 stop:698 length:114 start_codon:yes stop_codon:yes gene_type:complete